jgi:hypothetical protein
VAKYYYRSRMGEYLWEMRNYLGGLMEGKIKNIIYLNILCYLNNFVYILISSNIKIDGYISLWVLSPFVFLTMTSVLIETKYHKEHLYIKKYAIIDFILRFFGCLVAFSEFNLNFRLKIILSIILIILNIIIEIMMLNKKDNISYQKKLPSKRIYKVNESNTGKSQLIGIVTFIMISFFIGVVGAEYSIKRIDIKFIFLTIMILILFTILEYKKITEYYIEKNIRRKLLLRNIISFGCGVVFFILQKLLLNRESFDLLSNFIIIVSALPSIETTRNIAVDYMNNYMK